MCIEYIYHAYVYVRVSHIVYCICIPLSNPLLTLTLYTLCIGTNHNIYDYSYHDDDVLYFEDHGAYSINKANIHTYNKKSTTTTTTSTTTTSNNNNNNIYSSSTNNINNVYPNSPSLPPGVLGHHICTPYIFAYRVCDLAATRKQANYRQQLYSIVIPDKHIHTTSVTGAATHTITATTATSAGGGAGERETTAVSSNNVYDNKVYTQQGGDGYKSVIPVTTHNTGTHPIYYNYYYYYCDCISLLHTYIMHMDRIFVLWSGRSPFSIFGFRHRH